MSADSALRRLAQTRAPVNVVLRSRPGYGKKHHADNERVVMRFNRAIVSRYYLRCDTQRVSATNIRGLKLDLPEKLEEALDAERQAMIAKMIARVQESVEREGRGLPEAVKDMAAMDLAAEDDNPVVPEAPKPVLWLGMVKAIAEGLRVRLTTDGPAKEGRGIDNVSKDNTLECVVLASEVYQLDDGTPNDPSRWINLEQADAYRSLAWLLDPTDDFRGAGRTHVLIQTIVETALENPGKPIPIWHHSAADKRYMADQINQVCKSRRLEYKIGNNGDMLLVTGRKPPAMPDDLVE